MVRTEQLTAAIPAVLPEIQQLYRHFHAYPELSGQETETMRTVCEVLERHGIACTRLPENAGIVAEVGQGETVIGIRGELDALPITEETDLPYASRHPGIMHACGHDVHLAVVVGFLLLLKPFEASLPCRVRIFCQPAEETTGGAADMIRHGCMQDVTRVYGFHIDPTLPVGYAAFLPGVMNAAVTDFELTIRGNSCHGAHPEQGADAIVAAAGVITALQTLAARRFAPTTPVVVTTGTISGGTASNVIAGEVNMSGTLRALDNAVMQKLCTETRDLCIRTAQGYGTEAELLYTTGYPALRNDPALTQALYARTGALLGRERVQILNAPSLGADDFAFFSEEAPGCYFNIGCSGDPDLPGQVLHSSRLCPDEGCLSAALKILCLLPEMEI